MLKDSGQGGMCLDIYFFLLVWNYTYQRVKKNGHVSQRNIKETWATQLLEGSKSKGWPLLQCYFLHSIMRNDNLKFNF